MSAAAQDPGGQPTVPNWPKRPVLEWRSFLPAGKLTLPSLGDIANQAYTSSGRAALLAALGQMDLSPGSRVLVPTYHCPTMVAPVVQAGLVPVFYPIGPDGLPKLEDIAPVDLKNTGAMIVAHLFGLPRSLQGVQDWCRARHILLIEDCAHSYFGWAGDRPVGHWGDYAIGSLSKFFPVPEAGLLVSANRPLRPIGLSGPGLRAQVKALVDVVELAHQHGRLVGIGHLVSPLLRMKNGARRMPLDAPTGSGISTDPEAMPDLDSLLHLCDMSRARQRPAAISSALHRMLPQQAMVQRRHFNRMALAAGLVGLTGARPLFDIGPIRTAPYVLPLWVEDTDRADRIYAALGGANVPVFRWDRNWPGSPSCSNDSGASWRRQVLQLPCHQSLGNGEIEALCSAVRQISMRC